MKVNQIYAILNDINAEFWGADGVEVHDMTGLISLGDTVLSSDNNKDIFVKALVDRIGKTVLRTLDLEIEFPNLFMDSFEFGAILQKITVKPVEAIENDAWNIGEENFESKFASVKIPEIECKYFVDGMDSARWFVTIPDYQLESAFVSFEDMNNFFNGIIETMTDCVTMSINNMSHMCICNFVAEKIKNENGVVNLLSMYNEAYPNDNTVTDYKSAMNSPTFLRYAGRMIRNLIRFMGKPSYLYNVTEDVLRSTSRDNMHVFLNTSFISAYDTNYSSDVFHNELVSLPLYQEVEYWQGSGDEILDDESMTTINIIPSSDKKAGAGGTAVPVEATGVIGVIADRRAIAVGLNKQKSGAWYNPIDHYSNHSRDFITQYINDLSENGCVIIVAPTE